MIEALQNLLKLQAIEFGEIKGQTIESEAALLRGQIPLPILVHHDRLRVRGKKGLVPVRNQVCTGCHMSVPIGAITVLMRGDDVQLCENCGRYLYWPEPASPATALAPAPAEAVLKPAKPRKRRPVTAQVI